jgi:hypothetical protein
MMPRNRVDRSLSLALALGAAILLVSGAGHAAKKTKPDEYVVTEAQLQRKLMSYADRYAATASQVVHDVERLGPSPETRLAILGDLAYSAAGAFTIAADSFPQVALLDMVVLTTLGRMVFEDYWRPRLGASAEPAVAAFQKLERDVWTVAAPILSEDQQQELRERIANFHHDNPELSTFAYIRFADFPSTRASSTLQTKKSGGIFSSVKKITEQVEQTRIMAERVIYLSTRLPQLTGVYADMWVSRLSFNPAVEEFRADVHTLTLVSDRLATVAEQLPEQLTTERMNTIEQLVRETDTLRYNAIEHVLKGVTEVRQETLRQLIAEEEQLGGLLTELRRTLTEANTLTVSVDTLAQRFDVGAPMEPGEPAEPFDIEDYRRTIVDTGTVVEQLNGLTQSTLELLNSPGADRLVPGLIDAINEAGETGEDLVDHSILLAALLAAFLILIALVGYVVARLCYRWLAIRMFGDAA